MSSNLRSCIQNKYFIIVLSRNTALGNYRYQHICYLKQKCCMIVDIVFYKILMNSLMIFEIFIELNTKQIQNLNDND